MAPLVPGDRAPDFTIETTHGPRSLRELTTERPLVLVFYREDATPLCTAQVGAFRAEHTTLAQLGAAVLAVSTDDLDSHERFLEREGAMPFPLGADPELTLARAYDVVAEDGKRARRAVFVIGPDGRILAANDHYQPQDATQFAAVFAALGLAS